jgi:hypothetical protein
MLSHSHSSHHIYLCYFFLTILTSQAKSITKQFSEVRKRLEAIGYIVADFGQDGFALLRGEMVFIGGKQSVNSHLTRELTVGEAMLSKALVAPLLVPLQ